MTDLDAALDAINEANAFIVAYFKQNGIGELRDRRANWWMFDESSGKIEFDEERWDVQEEEGRFSYEVNNVREPVVTGRFTFFHAYDCCGNKFAAIFDNEKRIK